MPAAIERDRSTVAGAGLRPAATLQPSVNFFEPTHCQHATAKQFDTEEENAEFATPSARARAVDRKSHAVSSNRRLRRNATNACDSGLMVRTGL
jgi:hypothetical protein